MTGAEAALALLPAERLPLPWCSRNTLSPLSLPPCRLPRSRASLLQVGCGGSSPLAATLRRRKVEVSSTCS